MADHRSVNLELGVDKPDNVYRFIYDWQPVPSSHGADICYLLLHALVQWGPNREIPVNAFSIALQYSATPGTSVDVSQPPHIVEEDISRVAAVFDKFVKRRLGQR